MPNLIQAECPRCKTLLQFEYQNVPQVRIDCPSCSQAFLVNTATAVAPSPAPLASAPASASLHRPPPSMRPNTPSVAPTWNAQPKREASDHSKQLAIVITVLAAFGFIVCMAVGAIWFALPSVTKSDSNEIADSRKLPNNFGKRTSIPEAPHNSHPAPVVPAAPTVVIPNPTRSHERVTPPAPPIAGPPSLPPGYPSPRIGPGPREFGPGPSDFGPGSKGFGPGAAPFNPPDFSKGPPMGFGPPPNMQSQFEFKGPNSVRLVVEGTNRINIGQSIEALRQKLKITKCSWSDTNGRAEVGLEYSGTIESLEAAIEFGKVTQKDVTERIIHIQANSK
jgi:hypothetical protein